MQSATLQWAAREKVARGETIVIGQCAEESRSSNIHQWQRISTTEKNASKKDLLELAELDLTSSEIFLLDNDGKRVNIRSEEGLELQSGMRFVTVASKTNIGAGTHKSLA